MSHNRFLLASQAQATRHAHSPSHPDQENRELSVDDDFDSYWEEEARNPNRNRIRIGRQYQAIVPQLLESADCDSRRLEQLETLTFCPKRSAALSDQDLEHYLTLVKSLNQLAARLAHAHGKDAAKASLTSIALAAQPNANPIASSSTSRNTKPNLEQLCQPSVISTQASDQAHNKSPNASSTHELPKPSIATAAQHQTKQQQQQSSSNTHIKTKSIDPRMSVYNFDEEPRDDTDLQHPPPPLCSNRFECPKTGSEVKPLKAKPIIPNASLGPESTNSNVGSLKFFMDGQLVLKLNACQEQQEGTEKCHWVQSGDKLAPLSRNKRYTKRLSADRHHESQQNGSHSDSVVSSFQDDDSKQGDLTGDEDSKESMNSLSNLSRQNQRRTPTPKSLKIKNDPNGSAQGQSPSPINYNRLHANNRVTEPNDVVSPPPKAAPVMNPAMPWLNNSFAMAAALLSGLPLQPSAGNLMNDTQQNSVSSLNITSKPMDLSVEHSVPKPAKASSRSRSRQKNGSKQSPR